MLIRVRKDRIDDFFAGTDRRIGDDITEAFIFNLFISIGYMHRYITLIVSCIQLCQLNCARIDIKHCDTLIGIGLFDAEA